MVFSRTNAGYFAPSTNWARAPRPLTLRNDRHGLYRYDSRWEEDLLSFGRKKPYSFWSSAKYIFILSLMLWWIPTFGQMIAGYVGGRKAGNHWKAVAAASLPVALIWILALLAQASGSFPQLANLLSLPAMAAYGVGQAIPLFDPYIRFMVDYVTSFAMALKQTLGMGLNGYLITIIFAYIGGLIAVQTTRERTAHSDEEAVVRDVLPPYEPGFPPLEAPLLRPRASLTAGPSNWYQVHQERYDHLRRIPMAPFPYEEEPVEYYEPPRIPAQRRLEEGYDLDDAYSPAPERKPVREPPRRRRLKRLDKEELIRRLVERALREYDRSLA